MLVPVSAGLCKSGFERVDVVFVPLALRRHLVLYPVVEVVLLLLDVLLVVSEPPFPSVQVPFSRGKPDLAFIERALPLLQDFPTFSNGFVVLGQHLLPLGGETFGSVALPLPDLDFALAESRTPAGDFLLALVQCCVFVGGLSFPLFQTLLESGE